MTYCAVYNIERESYYVRYTPYQKLSTSRESIHTNGNIKSLVLTVLHATEFHGTWHLDATASERYLYYTC